MTSSALVLLSLPFIWFKAVHLKYCDAALLPCAGSTGPGPSVSTWHCYQESGEWWRTAPKCTCVCVSLSDTEQRSLPSHRNWYGRVSQGCLLQLRSLLDHCGRWLESWCVTWESSVSMWLWKWGEYMGPWVMFFTWPLWPGIPWWCVGLCFIHWGRHL